VIDDPRIHASDEPRLRALRILEHLNNKYALDGRDPSSYLNLHWLFGKFDRPFYRRPIYGTVRSMSLKGGGEEVRRRQSDSSVRGSLSRILWKTSARSLRGSLAGQFPVMHAR
jgi:hypothetical protein